MKSPTPEIFFAGFRRLVVIGLLFTLFLAFDAHSQIRYSVANGNWNATSTWSTTSGGASGAPVPTATDIVIIQGADNVTVNIPNAVCASLRLGGLVGGSGNGTLTISAGNQLTVNGPVNLGAGGTRTGTLNMTAAGTLICESLASNNASDVFTEGAGTIQLTANNNLPITDVGNQFGSFNNLTINGGTTTLSKNIAITGTLTVTSGILTLGAFNITNVAAINMTGTSITGTGTITLAGTVTTNLSATSALIGAPINAAANRTFSIAEGAADPDLEITSVLSGAAFGLIKTGAGTLELSGTSTNNGGTLTAGTLRFSSAAPLGAAGEFLALNGGTLDLALDGNINDYITTVGGTTTIVSNRGTTGAAINHTLGALSIGAFQLNQTVGANVTSGVAGVQFGSTTLTGAAVFDVAANANLTLGALVNNNAFSKQNSGQLTLNSASARTGGTVTVNAGELQLGNAGALGSAAVPLVLNGGTLDLAINTTVNFHPITVGAGSVTIISNRSAAGAGVTHTLGTLSIGGAQLDLEAGDNVSSGIAGLTFGATTLTGSPIFDAAANTNLTLGALSGNNSFSKQNSGQLTLNTGSARTGGTVTLNGGELQLGIGNALGSSAVPLVLNSGTLDLAIDASVNTYPTTVGGAVTILSNKATPASAGITHTLGTLSIGANTLIIDQGSNVTSGTATVQFGNLTMTGAPVFSPAMGVNLNLSGSASGIFKLTKSGAGNLQKVTTGWTLPADFEITAGTYNPSGQATTVTGLATISGGVYLAGSGLQTFNGGLAISGGTLTGSTGGVTTTNVTLGSGTLTAPSGAFNVSGNWSKTGGTFTPGGNTVNFTLGAGTQTLNSGGSSFNNIIHNGAGTLQLTGNPVTVGGTLTNSAGTFDAGGQATSVTALTTLSGGSYSAGTALQTFTGGLTVSAGNFNCSSGAVTAAGTLTVSGGNFNGSTGTVNANNLTLGSGTLVAPTGPFNVAGNWNYNGGTFTHSSGTVTFNGAAQVIAGLASTPFFNVSTSGASVTSINTATTIGNNLSIRNGTGVNVASFPFRVNGTTTVGGGASGNLTFSTATGPNTFDGLVTVASGATWNNTINAPMFFKGGITNSGTFTAGTTALHTFDTNPQSLTGTLAIPNVTVTGVTLINNNTLTVGTALEGTGILFQAVTGVLNVGGTSGIALIGATNAGNLVNFNGSSQTINPVGYHHLTVNQSAGTAVLSGPTSANGTLTLTAGGINLGGNTLTLGPSATVAGALSSTSMIIASGGGELRKQYSGVGSFLFPIGDNTAGADYSPITVNVTAGSFSSAYIGVSVVDAKHPSDASTTDYLTRYWNVTPSGITGCVADITGVYPGTDVTGSAANIVAAKLTGTFNPLTNPWTRYTPPLASPLAIAGATLPSGQISAITGIFANSPIADAGADKSVCTSGFTTLGGAPTASGGVGSYVYLWAPATGLSATNTSNPIFTAGGVGTTIYTVTITDSNGSIASDPVSVTVFATPSLVITNPAAVCTPTTVDITAPAVTLGSTVGLTLTYWTDAGAMVPFATPTTAAAGTYYIKGTTPDNCFDIKPVVATVNPTPTVVIVNPAAVCSPATVDLTTAAVTAGSTPGLTFTYWTDAGASIPYATPTTATAGTYYIKGTTGANCFDIKPVVVTVNPTPAAPGSSNPTPICVGGTTPALAATGTGTFTWYRDASLTTVDGTGSPFTPSVAAVNPVVAGTYLLYVTQTVSSCPSPATVVSVVVNPAVVANAGASPVTICQGTAITLGGSPTGTGGNGSFTFGWTSAPPGFTSSASNPLLTPPVGTTTYSVLVTDGNGCSATANKIVNVNPSPVLSSTLTPADICSGTTFNYTAVTATGSPSFAWTRALVGGISEAASSGSTAVIAETLTNTTTAPVNVTYVFVVTAAGCPGPAQNVVVTVNPNPVLSSTLTPASICDDATFNYTATSATVGATFSWSRAAVGGITPATSSGATAVISEALSNANTTPTVVTYEFTTSRLGCSTIQNVLLTVNPTPLLTSTVTPTAICSGTVFNYTATSSTTGAAFSWSRAAVGGISEGASAGAANVSETLTNTTTGSINVTYVYVVSANGCTNPSSYNVMVAVSPSPVLTSTLTPADICSGTTFNYTAVTATGSPSFAWTRALVGGISEAASSGSTAVIAETLTNTTTAPVNVTYVFVVTAAGCPGPAQNVVVTVNPNPVLSSTLTPASICDDATFNYTATSATVGATFSWSRAAVGGITPATSSGATAVISEALSNANTTPTVVTYEFTTSRLGCSTIQNVLLTVNPTPLLTSTVTPTAICSGTVFNYTATSSTTGAAFSWSRAAVGGISEGASAGAANVSETLTNTTTGSINVTYVYVVSANGCTNPSSYNVMVAVSPSPVLTSTLTPADICSGTTFNYTAVTATGSPSFAWTRALVGGISEAASSGSTAVIAETLTNTTTAPVNVTYVFVVTAAGCPGPAQNVVVTVNPNPVLSSTLTPASICDDATFNYTATSATVGATFSWSRAAVGGITPATSSGATAVISEALSNANTTPTVVTYEFTTSRLGCSTIQNVLLTVNPTPLLTSTVTPTAICSGTVFNYTATSSTTGAAFSWSRAAVGGISEGASAGAANVSETLTNTTTGSINVTYVYVVSANGCTNPSSYNVMVAVSPSPVLTSTLTPADICSGTTFNYTAVTATGSPSFAWTRALVGGISEAASSGSTAVIAETLTNTTTAPVNVTYVFVVTAAGCPGPAQNVVVTVNPNPVLSSTLTPASICDDATFNYTATSATVGATFSWSRAAVGGITPATSSGATAVISEALSNANTTPTVVTYEFTTSRLGCSTIQNVLLTVNPTPLLTSTVTPTAICSGTVFNYTATSSTTGAAFSWSRAAVGGISEGASAGAANVSETLTNTTTGSINVTYVYVVSANGCTNPSSYNVMVAVSPSPVLTSTLTPADICSGTTFNYTAVTATGSPSFAWTRALVGGISEAASSGSTAVIAETLTNTTTAPVNVTYVFVVTAAGCPGPAQNVVVTVNPNPVLSSTLTPASICDDATFNYTATSATVGATFSWSRAAVGGITPATSSGATAVISEALSNANTTPTVVTYEFTTSRLGCSTIQNVLLTVNPTPLLTSTVTPTAICSGTVFNYTATSSTTGAAFSWSRAAVGGISEGASAGAANVSETLTNTTTGSINVTYVYVVSANGCTNPSSYNVMVAVSPSPVLTSTLTPADICSGTTFNYTAVTATGSPSFAWTRALVGGISEAASSGSTAVIAETLTNTTTAPVNVTYVFVVTAAGCPGPAQNVVVTVNPNPVLSSTLTPASICDDATFNYTATSATVGATFSWSRAAVGGITPATSSGATAVISEALSNANTTPTVVTYEFTTSRLGCSTIQNVLLTVNPTPLLTSTVTPTAICSGTVFNYTATSSTTGAAFSWSRAAVGGISEGASAGAANVSETLTNTTTGSINVTYVYVVSANGCTNPSSYNVMVAVSPSPVLTSTLTPADICSGTTFNYTAVTATGSPSFAWTRALVGGISEAASSGSTAVIAETLTNTTTAPVNVTYVFVVTAAGCPGPAQNVVVTVNPNPVLSSTLTPASICDDATFNYTATSATVGATFSWSRAAVGGITPATSSGATAVISEALSNANTTPTVVTYEFTTSRLGCSTIQNVLLTVNPTPLLTSTVTPTAICSGTVFNYTATSSTTGAAFSWSRAAVGGISEGASAGAANVSETLTNTTTGSINVTYVYVVSANGCTNPSSYNVMVAVSPSPVLTSTLTPADICSGTTFNYTAVTATGSPSFAWTRALVGGISEAASSGSTAVIAETLTNTTTAPVNVTYVFVVTAAGCPGPAQNVVVTVNPNPVLSSTLTPASICDDATFNYTATSATVGATFSWSRAAVGGITPATSSGATAVISEALSNANTTPTVVTYEFTTSRLGCSTIQNVLLTVNPTPLLTSTVTPTAICSGTVFNYTATSSTTGAAFSWSRAAVGGISEGASAGAANVSETLTNTTTGSINVTYVYVVSANGCTNPSSYNVMVAVSPPAVFAAANTLPALCEGVATSINLTSTTIGQRVTLVSVVAPGSVGGYTAAGTQYNAFPASVTDMLTNSSTSPQTVTYTFEGSLAGTCINPAQQVVVVTVNPAPPDLSVVNPLAILCEGTPNDITVNSATANAVITLTNVLYNGATGTLVNGTTFTPGSRITETLGNNTNAPISVDYTFQVSANGCTNPATTTTSVSVKPQPEFSIINTTPIICEAVPVDITLNSPTLNAIVTLTNVNYGTVIGTLSAGATYTNGQKITEVLNNPTNVAVNVTYTFDVRTNTPLPSCQNPVTQQTVVIVKPKPSANGTDVTICSGQNAVIPINPSPENVAGTTYDWTFNASPNVVGATNDNGSLINQTITLTNFSVGTIQYHVTPTANGCVGPVKDLNVTVNPIATVNAGADYQVCEPVTIPLSGTIGGAATSGTWTIITGAGSISASSTSVNTVTATYTVNPADITTTVVFQLQTNDPDGPGLPGPCAAVSDLLNVQINKQPTVSVLPINPKCEPANYAAAPFSLSGTIGGSATTGLWSVITGNGGLSATSVSGSTVNANYVIDVSDVDNDVSFRLTTNDTDGLGPCVPAFQDVTIHTNQRAVVDAGPNLELCADLTNIDLQGSFGGSTSTVTWSGGSNNFSNANDPTSKYFWAPPELNTIVTLILTTNDPDGPGISGPCTPVFDIMTVRINPLPNPSFIISGSAISPVVVQEDDADLLLLGTETGGLFTIAPATSFIGPTTQNPEDQATFDPSLGFAGTATTNTITYTFTDAKGCTNFQNKQVIVNPVTSATFVIVGGIFDNLTNTWQICAEKGDMDLIGDPDFNKPGTGPNKFIASAGLTIIQTGTPGSFSHKVQTNGLAAGNYIITYEFVNEFGSTSLNPLNVKVFAAPIPAIQVNNSCIVDDIEFRDFSTLPATNPFPATITNWFWNFDDGQSSTLQNPDHLYTNSGLYDVILEVRTSQGCIQNVTKQIRVGDVPEVDFNWSAICNNDQTKFLDLTDPGSVSVITTYTWDFGDGNVVSGPPGGAVASGGTTGIYEKPDHSYVSFGSYNTKLTIDTNDGCTASLTKNVFILPYTTVTPASALAYTETFETNNGGWVAEAFFAKNSTPINIIPSDTSWVHGPPGFNKITPNPAGPNAWWTGKDAFNMTYYPYENSAVNGPCFNLDQLQRPMIAFDYWSDTQRGIDGVTLQYSIDAGLTWRIIGPAEGLIDRDQGINWFNGTGISANPGNQFIGQYGWTDRSEGWKSAKFNMDMIDPAMRSQVRIRFALGSNDSNPANENYDGFAFDNVYVGEKQRNVLVEHFTNSSLQASVDGDAYINNLYQAQIAFRGASDFYDIQYHINTPGADPLNADNAADPGARSTYMGVSQPPKTIMDGILNTKFTGKYTDLNLIELDRRALADPLFDLQLDTISTNDKNTISVRLTMTAKKAVNTPLIAQVAILENQTGTFENVLRKHLFGSDGETITLAFTPDLGLTRQRDNVIIDVPLTNPSQLTLVGYVQDKNTKEIYQSIVKPAPYKRGTVIVGLEETPAPTTLNGISIYPNPANGQFYFGLPDARTTTGFEWKLIDQRGVTVRSGDFEGAIENTKMVHTGDLANGVYIVMLSGPGKSVVHRKIVIMNRN